MSTSTTNEAEVKEMDIAVVNPVCSKCGAEILDTRVPRTEKQAAILRYLMDFLNRRGYRPSYAQIAKHVGVKSRATIAKHMRALRRQGFLKEA